MDKQQDINNKHFHALMNDWQKELLHDFSKSEWDSCDTFHLRLKRKIYEHHASSERWLSSPFMLSALKLTALFENWFALELLSEKFKINLGFLQVACFKLCLQDETVLHQFSHPFRLILRTLIENAVISSIFKESHTLQMIENKTAQLSLRLLEKNDIQASHCDSLLEELNAFLKSINSTHEPFTARYLTKSERGKITWLAQKKKHEEWLATTYHGVTLPLIAHFFLSEMAVILLSQAEDPLKIHALLNDLYQACLKHKNTTYDEMLQIPQLISNLREILLNGHYNAYEMNHLFGFLEEELLFDSDLKFYSYAFTILVKDDALPAITVRQTQHNEFERALKKVVGMQTYPHHP